MRVLEFLGAMVVAGLIYLGLYALLKWINKKNEQVPAGAAPAQEEKNNVE